MIKYVTLIHVGIYTRTGVAVRGQYLDPIDVTDVLPHCVRSDRGTETTLMTNKHWQFHHAQNPPLQFSDIYYYGMSILNVRIKSWWGQLTKSQTIMWNVTVC